MTFVKERKQFGRPIAEFQGLQWMLADMQTQLTASRLMLALMVPRSCFGQPWTSAM